MQREMQWYARRCFELKNDKLKKWQVLRQCISSPMHKMSSVKNSNDKSWSIMKHDWCNMRCQEHVWDVMRRFKLKIKRSPKTKIKYRHSKIHWDCCVYHSIIKTKNMLSRSKNTKWITCLEPKMILKPLGPNIFLTPVFWWHVMLFYSSLFTWTDN